MDTIKQVLDDLERSARQIRQVTESVNRQAQLVTAVTRQAEQVRAVTKTHPEDPWRLLSRRYTIKQRLATARAVAARMSTHFKDKRVVKALHAEASARRRDGRSGIDRWLREEVFVDALLAAAAERYKAQPVRLGKDWVGGGHQPVVPMGLAWTNTIRWLKQRARRLAEENILISAPQVPLSFKDRELIKHLLAGRSASAAAEPMGVSADATRKRLQRLNAKFGK